MAERGTYLRTPYSGYLHREVPDEDRELTHVGPGTPGGEYFRRFWLPVGLSDELGDLPLAVKILGEELVLFRDGSGEVGLLELHCSHRGTSLEYGRIAQNGIICCYHGWQFGADGRILDTPGEPPDSTLKDRLYHGAYPTHEYGGLVFAYMGPPDKKPPFPIFDTNILPGYRLAPTDKRVFPCNWLQHKENSMDPVHTVYLHTTVTGTQFTPSHAEIGTIDWLETPVGLIYIHTRRIGDNVWVHVNDFIPPTIHQFCATWEDGLVEKTFQRPIITAWAVPIDDTSMMSIGFRHFNENMTDEERARMQAQSNSLEGEGYGQKPRPYDEAQRSPGDFEAQISQRPIARHALEHLASTDRGVSMLRRMVRDGIRAVQRGEDPPLLCREEGKVMMTYSNDTIVRIPRMATVEEDNQLLFETGRKMMEDFLAKHPQEELAASAPQSTGP